jgi:hypothetical protein
VEASLSQLGRITWAKVEGRELEYKISPGPSFPKRGNCGGISFSIGENYVSKGGRKGIRI